VCVVGLESVLVTRRSTRCDFNRVAVAGVQMGRVSHGGAVHSVNCVVLVQLVEVGFVVGRLLGEKQFTLGMGQGSNGPQSPRDGAKYSAAYVEFLPRKGLP
jgi:hypothetical protein